MRRLGKQDETTGIPGRGRIYADDWEQASHNGDLVHAVEAGVLDRKDVAQLGDVLAGTAEGRQSDRDITIFDSTGLAIQDLAIALAAMVHAQHFERADHRPLGLPDRATESRVELLPEIRVLLLVEVVGGLLGDLLEWFLSPSRKRDHMKTVSSARNEYACTTWEPACRKTARSCGS